MGEGSAGMLGFEKFPGPEQRPAPEAGGTLIYTVSPKGKPFIYARKKIQ